MSQLALALNLDRNARFDTFVAGRHGGVATHLRQVARGRRDDTIWLSGPPGTGKTHLLQAACREADGHGRRAMYLPVTGSIPPDALSGLGALDLVAIDDVAVLAGDPDRELALFYLVDHFYRGAGALLLASTTTPAGAGFVLPDLASRAAGAIVYRLEPLSDEERIDALVVLARARGLQLDAATAGYLLRRVPRDMRAVAEWVDLLDRESLAARRRVTIPFVRELLAARDSESAAESGGKD